MALLRHVCRRVGSPSVDAESDQHLLERFVSHHDEASFEELLHRHGPLVLGVCRRMLANPVDVEDAVQATFLVLIRKADSVAWRESIGNYLYEVAYRVSAKVRSDGARRPSAERGVPIMAPPVDPISEANLAEVRHLLDDELRRLPAKYRQPLVLCYLQGRTNEQAAQDLGWPSGTVKGRLARARDLLRDRLARRGVALSAGGLTAVLAEGAAAVVPVALAKKVALLLGPGASPAHSSAAVSLATSVLFAMGLARLQGIAVLLLVGVLLAGLGVLVHHVHHGQDEQVVVAESGNPLLAVLAPVQEAQPAPGTDRLGDQLPPGAVARFGTTRLRHMDRVFAVAFSRDGRTMASSGDQVVRIWEAASGKELLRLRGHQAAVHTLAFSADGKSLVTGSSDKTVRVWNTTTGQQQAVFLSHKESVNSVCIAVDGKTVASGSTDRSVRLWDVATGLEVARLPQCQAAVLSVAFSPDGQALAVGSEDSTVGLFQVPSGNEIRRLAWPDNGQLGFHECHVAFSADGKTLAAGGYQKNRPNSWTGTIHLWDVATGKPQRDLQRPTDSVWSLAFAPGGKSLVSASESALQFWDVTTSKELRRLPLHHQTFCLALAPDGQTIATGDGGGRVRLWDVGTGKERLWFGGHDTAITSLAFTPDARSLVSAGTSQPLRLWQLATGQDTALPVLAERTSPLAISPDGKLSIYRDGDDALLIAETGTGKLHRRLRAPMNLTEHCVSISLNGKHLALGSVGEVRVWELASGKALFRKDKYRATALAFSPDGSILVLGGGDNQVRFVDIATGKELNRIGEEILDGHSPEVRLLAFAADGRTLAVVRNVGRKDGWDIQLWDRIGNKQVALLRIPVFPWSLVFSPDGRTLAAGGNDGILYMWETITGQPLRRFSGHEGRITTLAFSPDGRRLASGSADSTILIWDLTGQVHKARREPVPLSRQELEALAADLAGADADKAFQAIWTLVSVPRQSIPFMHVRWQAAVAADPRDLKRWIADLDSPEFAVRERATQDLERRGKLGEALLRQALADRPSLELRRRLEGLLEKLENYVPRPEIVRTVAVLEHINSPEARLALAKLATESPEADLADEATAALDRLKKPLAAKP